MKKLENGWNTSVPGFEAGAAMAGIKKEGRYDVAIIASTVPAACGAVFTQNKFCAAPVLLDREVNKGFYAQAIVTNSGCANACTGVRGYEDAKTMQAHSAEVLGLKPEEVFVCSTGVIGVFLPMEKLLHGIDVAADVMDENGGENAAKAIQTTDTVIKHTGYEGMIGGKKVTFGGIAKGSGMIHPNMATMLTYITTDAAIAPDVLKRAVKKAADLSFNMVVVDGDTSTNDSMIVLANGLAENEIILSEDHPDYPAFFEMLVACASDLARMIAKDGEGATKFLEVNVVGAKDFADAKKAAMAIAKSPLVKTAVFGGDPNWGRIACAAGYSGADLDPDKANLYLGGIQLLENGLNCNVPDEVMQPIMDQEEISLVMDLAVGDAKATVWTCDFSYEYVKINGEYRT